MRKHKQLVNEIIRYLLVGGLATVFDYLTFMLFRFVLLERTTISLLISTAMGFGVGVTLNYILSVIFVFKNVADPKRATKISSLILFILIGLVGLGITEFGMWLNSVTKFFINDNIYVIPEMIMKVGLTGIVLCWNYVARKMLIFKSEKERIGTTDI